MREQKTKMYHVKNEGFQIKQQTDFNPIDSPFLSDQTSKSSLCKQEMER